MDRISGLPDELLVKILSFAPTDFRVSTSILSKRWKFIWMWLPINLNFICMSLEDQECIDKYLRLCRALVIESFSLYINPCPQPETVKRWVEIAVSRNVRELKIIDFLERGNILPSSFYTSKSLVILELEQVTLEEIPSMACLHSLKTLKLLCVDTNDESLEKLLSICPVLEELFVQFRGDEEKVTKFTIAIPSLQSLTLYISDELKGYETDTPSLKYIKLEDWAQEEHYTKMKNMPKLVEACIDIGIGVPENVIGSITSVKRLTICPQILDTGGDYVFNQLENLKLKCTLDGHYNVDEFQIADSMPELRHLQLMKMSLTDTGLNSILDNFPHLEYLDLSKCSGTNLSGDSEKRCVERVKEYRRPSINMVFADTNSCNEEGELEGDDNSIESDE